MTPNIIDEAVGRLDFACATESKINTGDVALLLKAFKTSRRMVREQIAQLDAANARIAELEAWKAAVPVQAIRFISNAGEPSPDCDHFLWLSCDTEITKWLKQVQP